MNKKLNALLVIVLLFFLQSGIAKTIAPVTIDCREVELDITVASDITGSGLIDISISGAADEIVLLVLSDVLGRDVYSNSLIESSGNYLFSIPLEEPLIPGVYYVTASSNDQYMSKRIVVR